MFTDINASHCVPEEKCLLYLTYMTLLNFLFGIGSTLCKLKQNVPIVRKGQSAPIALSSSRFCDSKAVARELGNAAYYTLRA